MTRTLWFLGAFAALAVFANLTFGPAGADPKPALTVHMKGSQFSPADATVKAGDTVEFLNDDAMPHTVSADDKSFDSGNIAAGSSWTYTFSKAGKYTYGCAYHSWMHGRVVVAASQ